MSPEIGKFVCVALLVAGAFAAPPKKEIKMQACHKKDPKFNECWKKGLQKVVPELKDGYPKLKIPPIDPFDLIALDVTKGEGAVSIDLTLQNIKIYGLSTLKIEEVKIDPNQLTLFVRLSFPKPITMIGSYTAKGKVQVLPINGKGSCNITFIDPILEIVNTKAEPVVRKGVEYATIKHAELKAVHMSKLMLNMENLFQGNKQLSDHLNDFINTEWQLLYEELKPVFEQAIMKIVVDIAEKVATRIPLQNIFPE